MSVIDKTAAGPETEPRAKASGLRLQLLPERGTVDAIGQDGTLSVSGATGVLNCEILSAAGSDEYLVGDSVLFTPLANEAGGVVLGRIGRYLPAGARKNLSLEASDTLSLKCGAASIDLRADGKVMIRGEDVLVRAKGTKRIRAGTVSIN